MSDVVVFDGVACVAHGDVLFTMWRSQPTVKRMAWLRVQVDAAFARSKDDFVMVMGILPSSTPPDAETRTASYAHLKSFRPHVRRFVTLAMGDSFRMTVVRSIMRGIMMVTGEAATQTICATEEEALRVIHELRTVRTPTNDQLRITLRRIYAALGESREVPAAPALKMASGTR